MEDQYLYLAKLSWYMCNQWHNDFKLVKAKDKTEALEKIYTYYRKINDVKPMILDIDETII